MAEVPSQIDANQADATEVSGQIDSPTDSMKGIAVEGTPYIASTPTADPFSNLYNCETQILFVTGPLEGQSTEFFILGKEYFLDRNHQFSPGDGTAVYYEPQRYIILHSSYENGNILRPLEAEFIRKYLETWGGKSNAYIQEQIDSLIGSEVLWYCNGDPFLKTSLDSVIRLSHEASTQLWQNPQDLEKILDNREGLTSEWVGEISFGDSGSIYIGFCGWGPEGEKEDRYSHYRYLIRFTLN